MQFLSFQRPAVQKQPDKCVQSQQRVYRGKVHRTGADAEAGHLDKGDHGTAQQRHAENAKQQQPRHDRLRRAFLRIHGKKLRQVEEQRTPPPTVSRMLYTHAHPCITAKTAF